MNNNRKFLIDGSEVEVLSKSNAGYIVAPIYISESEEFVDFEHPFVVKAVYNVAPIIKYDIDIENLQKSISDLEKQNNELKKKNAEIDKDINEKVKMNAKKYYEERTLGSHPAQCDVCGKQVGMGSYLYLCFECYDKLPEHIQEGHHALIDYPEIRKAILKDAIERNKN